MLLRDTLDDLGWADALDETAAGTNPSATPARPGAAAASSSRSVLRDAVARLEAMSSRAQDLVFEVRTFVRLFVRLFACSFARSFACWFERATRGVEHTRSSGDSISRPISFRHDSNASPTNRFVSPRLVCVSHRRTARSSPPNCCRAALPLSMPVFWSTPPDRSRCRGFKLVNAKLDTLLDVDTLECAPQSASHEPHAFVSDTIDYLQVGRRDDGRSHHVLIAFFYVSRVSPERAPPEPAPWIAQSQPEPDPDPTPVPVPEPEQEP